MEILKHGQTYNKCTCDKCGCQIGYTEKDTIVEEEERVLILTRARWKRIYIRCPECNNKILVIEEI